MMLSTAGMAADGAKNSEPAAVTNCKKDLAQKLKLSVDKVAVDKLEKVQWSDTSLGLQQPGMMYAQVITPGYRVVLKAQNQKYLYHTGKAAIKSLGALDMWQLSALCVVPRMSDANMNGDLYQVSLFGGRRVKLVSDASQMFPQDNGIVAYTTRTSRSGFDLSYFDMRKPSAVVPLAKGFAFANCAVDAKHDRWAAAIRPGLGQSWQVYVGSIKTKQILNKLALPEGVKVARMTLDEDNVWIIAQKGEMRSSFKALLTDSALEFKSALMLNYPGYIGFMLNKSESVDVEAKTTDGKSVVEVSRLWFTGDRNPVVTIADMKLDDCDMVTGNYLWLTGRISDKPAISLVDINNGMTTTYTAEANSSVSLLNWPAPELKYMMQK